MKKICLIALRLLHLLPIATRAAVPTSLAKQVVEGSPRAREQAAALSRALRSILYGVRSASRPGRTKLAKTMADVTIDEKSKVLHLEPGARTGLAIISALQDIVTDEGEVSTARVTTPYVCKYIKFRRLSCEPVRFRHGMSDDHMALFTHKPHVSSFRHPFFV